MEDKNGHYLDKYGCSFGQVNRSRLESMEADMRTLSNRISWLLILLITQLATMLAYMITHWRPGP